MGTSEISLSVNDAAVELNEFVQGFIDHVVGGMLSALRDTGDISSVQVSIEEDRIDINLNNTEVPINPFVSDIIRNTIIGMVSSLRGVREAKRISINIKR